MEKTTDILNELKSISPLIAGMNKVNIYTVPEGYFSSVSTTIMASILEGGKLFTRLEPQQTTGIPEGYFDQLADSILRKIKIAETAMDEIKNLSPLLHAIQNKNVFEIPSDYFNNLNKTITEKIKAGHPGEELNEISPVVFGIQKKNVFETPAGYFENLGEIITGRLKTATSKEELHVLSPLLYSIRNEKTFEAPGGYFTGLADTILKKVQPQKVKVVTMHQRSQFIKYAVAAMMTGLLALGIYKYFDQSGSGDNPDQPMATIDASIEKGRSMNDQQFDEALQKLRSDGALVNK